MSKVTLDASLKARLHGLDRPIEFCDPDGTTLGQFLPTSLYQKLLHAAAEAACPFTQEQLDSFDREDGARTLKEFWPEISQR